MNLKLESVSDIAAAIESGNEVLRGIQSENDEFKNRIEDLEARQSQPGATSGQKLLANGERESKRQAEYRSEFMDWMRRPMDDGAKHRLSEAQHELATKDVTIGTDSAGGYALPEQISTQIERRVQQLNPFRSLVNVQPCGTNDFKALVDMGNATSGWVGETGTRSATDTPELRERAPTMGEIYAYPQVSEWALDDIFFDVGAWLVDSVSEQFASAEATAIVSGNGTNKPTGFLNTTPVTTADDASPMRDAAALQYIGLTSPASPVAVNYASLVDMVHSLKEAYIVADRVAWVMARTSLAAVEKIVDTTGQPIWRPSLVPGTPSTLLGYPVYTTDAMPAYAVDAFAIAFGNWLERRGHRFVR